jgi:ribonuclease HI
MAAAIDRQVSSTKNATAGLPAVAFLRVVRINWYASAMDELNQLREAAFKAERSAGRRLAAHSGASELDALRQVLSASAGALGLAGLLAERQARRDAEANRATRRALQRERAREIHAHRHDGEATPWRAWFDGSAHPNPGRCGIGALLRGPAGEAIEISQAAGHGSSSEAEYRALVAVLEAAVQAGAHGLTIYGDSQVVVNDVNSSDGAAAPSLAAYRARVHTLMAGLSHVVLRWIPRHKNPEADALSQRAVAKHGAEDALR